MPSRFNVAKLVILLAPVGNAWAKTVTVTNGTIHGGVCTTSNANTFLGIPYALAPSRFAAPEPHNKPYQGVLHGSVQPPRCPQFGTAYVENGEQSEDWYGCMAPLTRSHSKSVTAFISTSGLLPPQATIPSYRSRSGFTAEATKEEPSPTLCMMAATRRETVSWSP